MPRRRTGAEEDRCGGDEKGRRRASIETGLLCLALSIYWFVLIGRIILSWVPQLAEALGPVAAFVYGITEPVLRLARPLVPPLRLGVAALDLSPILVFVLLSLVRGVVCRAGL